MTCIAGIAQNGTVTIGGDSAGIGDNLSLTLRSDGKVFRAGSFLFGISGSFRMGQLLRYVLTPPAQEAGMSDMHFLVGSFIPAVQQCLKEGGWLKNDPDKYDGGQFLFGYRGTLYQVDPDFQVAIPADQIATIGAGEDVAMGAMYGLPDILPPDVRVKRALQIAERLNGAVRGPFVIDEV